MDMDAWNRNLHEARFIVLARTAMTASVIKTMLAITNSPVRALAFYIVATDP